MSEKTVDDYFTDWESHVFGFGYGTGEGHILPALRQFLELCGGSAGQYDYKTLEEELGATVAWLLINALAHADILDYGTSPRYAWLNGNGRRLKDFVASKTNDELYGLTCRSEDYPICYPDVCNCGPNGYEKDRVCNNPFWRDPDRK